MLLLATHDMNAKKSWEKPFRIGAHQSIGMISRLGGHAGVTLAGRSSFNLGIEMKLFSVACLFGLLVASLGCMTNNWNSSLFRSADSQSVNDKTILGSIGDNSVHRSLGKGQAFDSRARDIEKRLGYSDQLGY